MNNYPSEKPDISPEMQDRRELPWYAQPSTPSAPTPTYTSLDGIFACLFLVLGYLMICALPVTRHPLGGALILVLLFALGGLYLRACGIRASLRTALPALLGGLLAFSLITNGNTAIRNITLLLVTLLFFCWIYQLCGLAGQRLSKERIISHVFRALFQLPWSTLGAWFLSIGSLGKKSDTGRKLWKTLGWIAVGLLCAVVPTMVIALLLSYDSQFTALLRGIFSFSLDGFGEFLLKAIFAIPTAVLLFGGVFAVKWRREVQEGAEEKPLSFAALHVLPRALLCAAVTPVLALYVLFFISQWEYYVSAFTHVLPEGLTYAAYAREGFFQLCAVCFINAALLWVFHALARTSGKEPHPVQRVYAGLISVFTLILIATALSKMILYIDTYGLTQKRVYASWAMIFLAVIFVAVLLRQILRRFPATATVLVAGVLLFALIALPNVDGMIASYNVDRYLAGDLTEMDVSALDELGVSAVPAMIKLEKELADRVPLGTLTDKEQAILTQTSNTLNAILLDLYEDEKNAEGLERIFHFSIPTARARALLKERWH